MEGESEEGPQAGLSAAEPQDGGSYNTNVDFGWWRADAARAMSTGQRGVAVMY
jgi:hypothetical protein